MMYPEEKHPIDDKSSLRAQYQFLFGSRTYQMGDQFHLVSIQERERNSDWEWGRRLRYNGNVFEITGMSNK